MALIVALEALKERCELVIHTDSKYLMNAFEKHWIRNWKRNGWLTSAKEPVQNQDLWRRLDALLEGHAFLFKWIKGHASDVENNRCDALAVEATRGKGLEVDGGYEEMKPFSVSIGGR